MAFDYSTLIIDRAASDSDALRALVKKPMSQWTAAEAEAFTAATLKGSYDYTDLNRVSACMEDLVARLNGLGYQVPGYERVKIERTVKPTSRLPEGYTEVEYIQSSGTQYVDSLFTPNQDTRVVMDAQMTSNNVPVFYFGTRPTGTSVRMYNVLHTSSGIRSDYGTSQVTASGLTATNRMVIDKNKNICSMGTSSVTNTSSTFQTTFNLFLFASNDGGNPAFYGSFRLFACQIYDNGTLIRNYVPCKNADNAVGLYDLVGGQFYGNAGTGSFTAGDVVESASESDTEELDPYLWYPEDAPTQPQIEQYRGNVAAVRAVLAMPDTTPEVPETLRKPTTDEVNTIESILAAIDLILTHIPAAHRHCGVTVCGLKGVIA